MAVFTRGAANKIDSAAMRAAAADYAGDTVSTLVVLLCLLLNRWTGLQLDGWGGLLVALLILKAGLGAAWETLKQLLGRAPDPELVKRIESIVLSYEDIIGLHDLVVHDYGPGRLMISLHAEVPGDGDIYQLHDTVDLAMAKAGQRARL